MNRWYTHKDFISGLKDSGPIFIAFIFMCISFGGLSKTAGISIMHTMIMAMLIYSIPLQVFLISLTKDNLTLTTIVALTFVINARFFLMSLSLVHHFKNISGKKIMPALLIISASSFTVSHVKFSSETLEKPFSYYLGVALVAYLTTFFSTLAGYYIAFINNNFVINHVFSIALAIHFTALTAIRYPNMRLIISTAFGFIMIPFLAQIISFNVTIFTSPFLVALIMLLTKKELKKS